MKYTLMTCLMGLFFLASCEPQTTTKEDKEAVKKDTVDPRQGKGEGEVGEGVYGR